MEQKDQTAPAEPAEQTEREEQTAQPEQEGQAEQAGQEEETEQEEEPREEPRKEANRVVWRVLLGLTALVFFAFLELNRHVLLGWALTVFLIALYSVLRGGRIGRITLKYAGLGPRILAFLAVLIGYAVIAVISWPPVKPVPALEGAALRRTDVIHIAQGDLTGVYTADGEVEVFTGIPYAQPPVGELRWRSPQQPQPWEGELQADKFAPMSMQPQSLPIVESLSQIIGYHDYAISITDNYRAPVSEDSLYVNIWKPAGEVSSLPVLVYIHGGSLQTGQPWYADYSGEGLARQGVVVVNMGYRLGIFGFFADEELAAENASGTTGNYGLMDQIAALYWVQNNIAAFGGDPGNVTLAGESAGSACVTALCTSPLTKGLFRRVVGESSTVTAPEPAHSFRTREEALRAGQETKERLGVQSVEELRAMPAEKLVEEAAYHHHITVDGFVLTETPWEAYTHGNYNEEAILQGFNLGESGPFLLLDSTSLENYEAKVRALFGDMTDKVLALYPAHTDAEAQANWAEIYTVYYFAYGHHCWARQAVTNKIPIYMYHFKQTNGRLSNWHSGEEVYFYGNIPDNSSLYTDYDRRLSAAMQTYLVNFMKNGNPNGVGFPSWYPMEYTRQVLVLGEDIYPEDEPYEALYSIMDRMYKLY